MEIKIEKVKIEEKEILFILLQFALYDGSNYYENNINNKGFFEYKWFDNYFTDDNRDAFFIKSNDNKLMGFIMINTHLQILNEGHSIAEFLVLPSLRRHHIGKQAAFKVLNLYKGNWEIEPLENSNEAYCFWNKVVKEYTNNKYEYTNDIFIINNEEN